MSDDVEHTPAPWQLTLNPKLGPKIWGTDGDMIAKIKGGVSKSRVSDDSPTPEWKHNALLIKAAPDLLRAAKEAEKVLDRIREQVAYDAEDEEDALDELSYAIDKAENRNE